ncbi:unannotated protein [freshwater metagenome]|uniref:Unannotated protein n=1 Tax=freshwater metagenome TaxID=449393 RepID=A0A6J7JPP4_9ZZZZ|nr:PIN domain-containing protein [Actinomycetota bacterium]
MFMLDTNVLIALQKGDQEVARKLSTLNQESVGISSIVELEFRAGLIRETADSRSYQIGHAILDSVRVYPFDSSAATSGARLKLLSKNSNKMDTLIAAHAIAMGRVLVTNNTKDFENIPGLKLDNWAE